MHRRLRLKARSKLGIDERDGGLFLCTSDALPAFEPIDYLSAGSLKVNQRMIKQDRLFGDEST